jgi:hypothetical protein
MKIKLIAILAIFSCIAVDVFAGELEDQFLKEAWPLIGRVRGAVRSQIEEGKGCLPWASLTGEVGGQQDFIDFGFTPDMAKDLGEDPLTAIVSRLRVVANRGPFTAAAVGFCDKDRSRQITDVIVLFLERRNGMAFKLRFPFQRTADGKISYRESTIEGAAGRLFANTSSNNSGAAKPDAIQINEAKENYELTVPVSRLFMSIPREGLTQVNQPHNNPRYFYFEDRVRHLIISGWFEPEQRFSGVKKSWEDDTQTWNRKGLPEPKDVVFTKVGSWDAIIYEMPAPAGIDSHIRAHWLQAGTWIEIHLSTTSAGPSVDSRAKLHALLMRIQVKEK